jgi:hypothetical protein
VLLAVACTPTRMSCGTPERVEPLGDDIGEVPARSLRSTTARPVSPTTSTIMTAAAAIQSGLALGRTGPDWECGPAAVPVVEPRVVSRVGAVSGSTPPLLGDDGSAAREGIGAPPESAARRSIVSSRHEA